MLPHLIRSSPNKFKKTQRVSTTYQPRHSLSKKPTNPLRPNPLKLILQFLRQTLHILRVTFPVPLAPISIARAHMAELGGEDGFVDCAAGFVAAEGEGAEGVAVVGAVAGYEVGSLGLREFYVVLSCLGDEGAGS